MKRIFLSMPYTQVLYKEFDKYIKPIGAIVYTIIDGGAVPVCSVLTHHHAYTLGNKPEIPYERWFQAAISDLKTCDEMWVLKFPTWDTSSGVAREIELAGKLNIHVEYINMGYDEE